MNGLFVDFKEQVGNNSGEPLKHLNNTTYV